MKEILNEAFKKLITSFYFCEALKFYLKQHTCSKSCVFFILGTKKIGSHHRGVGNELQKSRCFCMGKAECVTPPFGCLNFLFFLIGKIKNKY